MPPKRAASKGVATATKKLRSRRTATAKSAPAVALPDSGTDNTTAPPAASPTVSELSNEAELRIINKITQQIAVTLPAIIRESLLPSGRGVGDTVIPPATPSTSNTAPAIISTAVEEVVSHAMGPIIGESAQATPTPLYSQALPVGSHIDDKVRAKIHSKQYVDMSDMLSSKDKEDSSFSLRLEETGGVKQLMWSQPPKKQLTMGLWITAWNRFVAIYLEVAPHDSAGLSRHFETVRNISQLGGDWRRYDEDFRRELARGSIEWMQPHYELYFACCMSGLSQQQAVRKPSTSPRPQSLPPGVCYAFHRGKHCANGNACRFQHSCFNCGKPHQFYKCNQPHQLPFRFINRSQPKPGFNQYSTNHVNQSNSGPRFQSAPINSANKPTSAAYSNKKR